MASSLFFLAMVNALSPFLITLKQGCQTQVRGPNLAPSIIIFGPRDNFKCVLELARLYIAHAPLILQIPECFASALTRHPQAPSVDVH